MNAQAPIAPDPEDFEAIEAAVLSTERGRRFLAEYARRNRAADTAAVLSALDALGGRLAGPQTRAPDPDVSQLAVAISKMAVRLALMRADLEAPGRPDRRVVRALRRLVAIDRLASQAASVASDALGAPPVPRRSRPAAIPPVIDPPIPATDEAGGIDAGPREVVAAFDTPSPAPQLSVAEIAGPDVAKNGSLETAASETPVLRPQLSGGRQLPLAWTPEFLLGLTDDDRPPST